MSIEENEDSDFEGLSFDEEWEYELRLDGPNDEPLIHIQCGEILRTNVAAREVVLAVLKEQIARIEAPEFATERPHDHAE